MKNDVSRWTMIAIAMLTLTSTAIAADTTYHVLNKISIPGDGGWDYLFADSEGRALYVSHGTQVEVLDMDKEQVEAQVAATPGVHGIALSPNRGFTSNGKAGTVSIFDRKTYQTLSQVHVGDNPDAILYDDATKRVFTFNGRSQDMTALDASSGTVVGHLALGGKPEFAVADGNGMLFDNLEDKSQLVQIDANALTVTKRWPLTPCEEPSGLAMDREHRRLFVGCSNHVMAVVNADDGHVITTLPIGDHVDATVFEPGTDTIFNSNGDGTLTVIHEDSPDKYHVVQNVTTQRGARTMAVDTKTHKVFLATATFGPTPAPTADQPHPRPSIVPGTFTILVVGRTAESRQQK